MKGVVFKLFISELDLLLSSYFLLTSDNVQHRGCFNNVKWVKHFLVDRGGKNDANLSQ